MTAPSSLKRRLRQVKGELAGRGRGGWPGFLHPAGFSPYRTIRAQKEVEKRLGEGEVVPPSHRLDELHGRIRAALNHSDPVRRLSLRDLRQAPWVFFHRPSGAGRQGPRLGLDPRWVSRYRKWLAERRNTRAVLALLHEFLREYPIGRPTFASLRYGLSRSLETGTAPRLQRARERCRRYRLLETGGELLFVKATVTGKTRGKELPERTVGDVLGGAGLATGLAECGFLRSGLRRYLERATEIPVGPGRVAEARLERLIRLLEFQNRLRFPDLRPKIAKALLGPFIESDPTPGQQERIRDFLFRQFGHPRLRTGQARWRGVRAPIQNVFLRWMARQSLDAFFNVMRETAYERHWKYRERFWRAHAEAGVIADAWFVPGGQALRSLERLPGEEGQARGALRGAGSDQSVLLMRLRGRPGLTVAEWSHRGACRLWREENPDAPRLYREDYQRHDHRAGHGLLTPCDAWLSHTGSESGLWQDRLAASISEYTGAPVPRSDYLAKGVSSPRGRPAPPEPGVARNP